MYIKSIEIENVGPLNLLNIQFPTRNGNPVPVILVGENGSGKSIVLSHVVNSLIVAKHEIYEDTEVEKGRVFKYRSPDYVNSGSSYSYSSVEFDNNIKIVEWQLNATRKNFEEKLNFCPSKKDWGKIPEDESSFFDTNFHGRKSDVEGLFSSQCCLYFPVNRFEEPAWLNKDHLLIKSSYSELKHISGYSNRNIICESPLKNNMNWLLDILFDRATLEIVINHTNPSFFASGNQLAGSPLPIFSGYSGTSTTIYETIINILHTLFRSSARLRFGIGNRSRRRVSVIRDDKVWIPNLFQLSTGETQLLNLFLSIIRDFDLTNKPISAVSDITGIVIIDEIDAHLHTILQKEVLPKLIRYFPKIQFVITSHSPLFLIGMEEQFGSDGILIYNLPTGVQVAASDFSEFTAAYEAFKETTRHREEIAQAIQHSLKPLIFVEGDYDVKYIKRAAELLGKKNVMDMIQIKDGDGFGNLDKIYKSFDNPMSGAIQNRLLLLYDCDTKKTNIQKNRILKRIIPSITENPIEIGIENLLPAKTIDKLETNNPRFIDIHVESTMRIRGETKIIPHRKSINKDEKGNICNWLCEHGTVDDFLGFSVIFNIIEDFISADL
ncbi:putative ATP-binding protein involved in virulence [Nitrospirillum pindoramense]|uniref:Putative ATP-binding protein involved in virulence n=2 Tax=Nitrospirillum amazonense TaxID=28077 RepID=A0A560GKP0_9PROT|nr:putative ATP-binding protein involved in virulence [Nitrospirillum amazonense]